MASELQQAVKQVKEAASMFEAVIALSKAVEKFGNVELLESRAKAAQSEFDRSGDALKGLKAQIAAGEASVASLHKQAGAMADEMAAKAQAAAKPLVEAAELKVKDINQAVKAGMASLLDLNKAVEAKKKELSDFEARIAKSKHDAIKSLS